MLTSRPSAKTDTRIKRALYQISEEVEQYGPVEGTQNISVLKELRKQEDNSVLQVLLGIPFIASAYDL